MDEYSGNQIDTGIGIVYVLANPAMPDFIKIGFTRDLAERMRSLDGSTAIPLPFECVYAAKVSNPRAWERVLHEVFSEARVNRKREFFHSEITAKASLILQTAKVEDVTHMAPSVAANDETPSESKRNSDGRRDNFNFEMLGIETGSLLQFFSDETVVCKVTQLKPPRVLYAGEEMTVTEAAAVVMERDSTKGLQGPLYWKYQGETLVERRKRLEGD